MVKDVAEKLNQKYDSKIAWNAAEYIKYKQQVESARIEHISSLINEFNDWATLSDEEDDQLYDLIQDLRSYVSLLYKINEELNDCIKYLKGE